MFAGSQTETQAGTGSDRDDNVKEQFCHPALVAGSVVDFSKTTLAFFEPKLRLFVLNDDVRRTVFSGNAVDFVRFSV